MDNATYTIENWLSVFDGAQDKGLEVWDPGFDGDRCLVVAKFGPFARKFARPPAFVATFWHRIYPLPIENWQISFDTPLYGGFCTLTTHLHILFQPTIEFAKRTLEAAPNFNNHIKNNYYGLLMDIITAELCKLDNDHTWLDNGLHPVERQIATAINEIMIIRGIQCRARCLISPVFDLPDDPLASDDGFTHSDVYKHVSHKRFAFRQQKEQELLKQQVLLEQLRVEHQQAMLEIINEEDELERKKQALEAEAAMRQLEEKRIQRLERNAMQLSLHEDQVNHKLQQKTYEFTKEAQLLKKQQNLEHRVQLEIQAEQVAHDLLMKKKQRENELICFEQNRLQLLQAKDHEEQIRQIEIQTRLKKQEIVQTEQFKLAERLEAKKLNHEARLNEMQIQAELKILEMRAEATKNKDSFLRKEIEWLVLDKRRAELTRAIRAANQDAVIPDEADPKPPL